MTPTRKTLTRLFPAAALIAALGLPTAHLAQADNAESRVQTEQAAEAVSESTDAGTESAGETTEATTTEQAEETQPDKPKEKTPEQLAKEAEKKELEKLQREATLRSARLKAELAPLQAEKTRIEAELSLLNAKQQAQQAQAKLEKAQADFEHQLAMAELSRELSELQQMVQQMTVQSQIAKLKQAAELEDLSAKNAKMSASMGILQAELALLQTQRSAASVDKDKMEYPQQPLKDGVLTISDRRIPLNGAIGGGTADYVTQRIHYYNNLDPQAPIFIVIDGSPGGSVMEGYRIVTAMQNSDAPVHVVVKSYAASMAAVITTLAEESYAYPNAVILHHQMSSGMRGNLTQQKESLEEGFEWAKRLADPVAEKMGVSYDKFVDLMYKNNSDGDWAEFADKAKKLKWVNHVVEEIRETALVTAPTGFRGGLVYLEADTPDRTSTMPRPFTQEELFHSPIEFQTKTDGNGRTYTELPPLAPFDYYFMYDPDQRYRLAK